MLNGLGLFAGIGGLEVGLERAGLVSPVCFVEKDAYAQKVLAKRFPEVPIWDDVTTFDGKAWEGCIDFISGGFPCQDISVAGKGAGIRGSRSGLWTEFKRVIREVRPLFALIENVPMLINRGFDVVLSDLCKIGYSTEWFILSAADMGAPHLRKRVFVLAYSTSKYSNGIKDFTRDLSQPEKISKSGNGCGSENVADSNNGRSQERRTGGNEESNVWKDEIMRPEIEKLCSEMADSKCSRSQRSRLHGERKRKEKGYDGKTNRPNNGSEGKEGPWYVEPDVGRVADGISTELDSIARRLGYENGDSEEAITAIDRFRRKILRIMWEEGDTETSCGEKCRVCHDFMSEMPHEFTCEKRYLGERIAQDIYLYDMWERIQVSGFKHTQDVLKEMLEKIREIECDEKMGKNRVSRLKCLGNAVVPQCAECIGRLIMDRIKGRYNKT
jgi:DNA (cytosine-5)-methyltransferase 1